MIIDEMRSPQGFAHATFHNRAYHSKREPSALEWGMTGQDGSGHETNSPRLPWRHPAGPEFFQPLFVPQCVHRLPEAAMEIGLHLPFQREILHRFAFEHRRIVAYLIKHPRRENHESAIDPSTLAFRLPLERGDGGPVYAQSSEPNRCHGHLAAVTPVESDGSRDVDIAYTVRVMQKAFLSLR
jgi:hypothetical protein